MHLIDEVDRKIDSLLQDKEYLEIEKTLNYYLDKLENSSAFTLKQTFEEAEKYLSEIKRNNPKYAAFFKNQQKQIYSIAHEKRTHQKIIVD